MTIKFSSVKNDIDAERNGLTKDIPEWPGVSITARSTEYEPYRIALEQLVQRFARKYRNKTVPPEERDCEVGKLIAAHLLIGWNGFDEEYDANFAKEILGSAEGRNFAKHILWVAGQAGHTEVEFVEESVKNFAPPSDTN